MMKKGGKMKKSGIIFILILSLNVYLFAENPQPFFRSYKGNPLMEGELYQGNSDALWAIPLTKAKAMIPKSRFNAESLTITAWLAPANTGDYRQIVFKGDRGSQPPRVDFKFGLFGLVPEFGYMNARGEWRGLLRNHNDLVMPDGKRRALKDCPQASPYHWNFCAVTFDRGMIRLYLNGKVVAEGRTGERQLVIANTPLLIGYGQNSLGSSNMFLNGLLKDIQLYDKALDFNQIELIRKQQSPHYSTQGVRIRLLKDVYADEYDPKYEKKLSLTAKYEAFLPECNLPEKGSEYYVADFEGMPRLFRDGNLESGMCMMPECAASNLGVFNSVRDFAAAGVDYVSEIFWPWLSWGENCSQWWLAPGKYDFPKIEARLQKIIEANPNAKILVRCKMNVPQWWLKQYPGELGTSAEGKNSVQPSLASDRWLVDCSQMLYDVTRHLENSRYARNIAGYVIAGGETSEWFWWGWSEGKFDYSQVAVNAFRQWLSRKYSTDKKLQEAWNDPKVTLKTAKIPSVAERRETGKDKVFTPTAIRGKIVDYRRFMSDTTVNSLIYGVKRVREALSNRKLIGTFYGYSMYMDQESLANLGFQNLKEVLECKDVDFICAPMTYVARRGGEAGNFICEYSASLRMHGKLYWDEADMRTHLCNTPVNCKTTTPDEPSEVNWRTFGNSLVQATNIWWFLIAGNAVFHSERIMNEISQMSAIEREVLAVPRKRTAQVAVICDEQSMEYAPGSPFLDQYVSRTMEIMPKIGTPFDTYLLSDLESANMPDYKLYIFLNAYYITKKQRTMIHRKLAKNYAAALWIFAPGYLSEEGDSTQSMKCLTGLSFMADFSTPYLSFIANRPSIRTAWGTSYYSYKPVSPEKIRQICREQKIHLYLDSEDIFRGNNDFVMIHAAKQGIKTLTFPQNIILKDLKNGNFSQKSSCFRFFLRHGETALFQVLHQ